MFYYVTNNINAFNFSESYTLDYVEPVQNLICWDITFEHFNLAQTHNFHKMVKLILDSRYLYNMGYSYPCRILTLENR